MTRSRFKNCHLLAAFLGLTATLTTTSLVFAQDAAQAMAGIVDADNASIVPDKAFPSLIALDPSNTVWTLKVSDGRLNVNGDVAVNSPNRGAFWISNSAVDIENGAFNVVGNVSRLGRISIQPAPNVGSGAINDPFPQFTVDPPANVVSNDKLFLQTDAGGKDTSLPPGIYNGGIFASGNGHITLQPGVYVIANGDFSVIGPTVEGKGVTIIMGGEKAGALSFSLGARFNASAPTAGKFKDLLVVSRKSGALSTGVSFSVARGDMQGVIYAPTSGVSVQSKASVQVSKVIAKNIDVTGASLRVTGFGAGNIATDNGVATDGAIAAQ